MPPVPATPCRAAASHPLLPALPALPALPVFPVLPALPALLELPPRVTGAVNICTGPDKEKANRIPLFMGLGSRVPGQLRGVSILSAPQLGLSPCPAARPCRLLCGTLPPRRGQLGTTGVGGKAAG